MVASALGGYLPVQSGKVPCARLGFAATGCQSGIQQIECPYGGGEKRIVTAGLLARSLQHRFQPLGVGDRNSARVEEVHGRADGGERADAKRNGGDRRRESGFPGVTKTVRTMLEMR